MPGLVDAHCHVGLDAQGAVDESTQEQQATAERDAGALLIRDAGSPAGKRAPQRQEDLIDDADDVFVGERLEGHDEVMPHQIEGDRTHARVAIGVCFALPRKPVAVAAPPPASAESARERA